MQYRQRLQEVGLSSVHRWKYLLVGAIDEDQAKELAERIRGEAPEGSQVQVEGTWTAVWHEIPSNRFAVFGGLGG